ncbi:hypothetical protein GRI89_05005 [Altererythrobacter salegens]|uniref:Uncharacterized protein n=1 Tax=Croceibacterium salegens TaxID=1737568 RepID=A0A6I4SU25_9SPHN|nr:hypothetical protein [Croceibacterium salegens]MXO58898.1 hypothetical protein [Croceibacterium salegens]
MSRDRLLAISRLLSEAEALAGNSRHAQGIRDAIAGAQRAVAVQLDNADRVECETEQ